MLRSSHRPTQDTSHCDYETSAMATLVQSYGGELKHMSFSPLQPGRGVLLEASSWWIAAAKTLMCPAAQHGPAAHSPSDIATAECRPEPEPRQQLTASDVIALYFSAHWCPPCRPVAKAKCSLCIALLNAETAGELD